MQLNYKILFVTVTCFFIVSECNC